MKKLSLYSITLILFSLLLLFLLNQGKQLEGDRLQDKNEIAASQSAKIVSSEKTWEDICELIFTNMIVSLKSPLCILILQIFIIMVTASTFKFLFIKIGQPGVLGEIIAGVILGPSVLDYLLPGFSTVLFPKNSLDNLNILSQIGLMLFMFVVGMELDMDKVGRNSSRAVFISFVSSIIPFLSGEILAFFIYRLYAPENVSFSAFALFIGLSMSITAFPVLARIVRDRGLINTDFGDMVLVSASFSDIAAWCVLTVVVAITSSGNIAAALVTVILSVLFVTVMFFVLHPVLKRSSILDMQKAELSSYTFTFILAAMFLLSFITETLGIHTLFGAFTAGVIIPKNKVLRKQIKDKIEDISLHVFLPLFFALMGLKIHINILSQKYLWIVCLGVIFVAVTGKFGGSLVAARITGLSWKDSLSMGVLMNTRGLMELIVLNIGYDKHIFTEEIFTVMIVMTLVTTFMAGPALNLIDSAFNSKRPKVPLSFNETKTGNSGDYLQNNHGKD